jgi:IS605 OrfB family transposase
VSHQGKRLREVPGPFVVAPPSGARVRTRLAVNDNDEMVLEAWGAHLGRLASLDLAHRVAEGPLDAKGKAESRRARKQALTGASSSRWAGAITRTSEDAYGLAKRDLQAERASLRARVDKITKRVALGPGEAKGRVVGYRSASERWEKQRRAQILRSHLADVEAQLAIGTLSVCRGGKRLARARHHLGAAGQTLAQWRTGWDASRWFITADGEADKTWGNETIRWHPVEGWLEIKLPAALAGYANRPHNRYRLSCSVRWPYRGDDVAAQATNGAVRYDITYEPSRDRWYIDASWAHHAQAVATLDQLRYGSVVSVDLNVGHLAVSALDRYGNPLGPPITIPLELAGLRATTRDGHLRAAISEILAIAEKHHAGAVVIEDLDFVEQRTEGREHAKDRPSRGKRGKAFRRQISGLPTAQFRDRLTQMADNAGVAVIAVGPAYTSLWGAQHWLAPLQRQYPRSCLTGHHAAAVAIGRRGLRPANPATGDARSTLTRG